MCGWVSQQTLALPTQAKRKAHIVLRLWASPSGSLAGLAFLGMQLLPGSLLARSPSPYTQAVYMANSAFHGILKSPRLRYSSSNRSSPTSVSFSEGKPGKYGSHTG